MNVINVLKGKLDLISKSRVSLVLGITMICTILSACDSPVDVSPEPGVFRVTIEPLEADSTFEIAGNILHIGDEDSLHLNIFQGRAYQDTVFSTIYPPPLGVPRQEDRRYNLFARAEDGGPKRHTIFETHLPPRDFNRLEFGIRPELMIFDGGLFTIPVEIPPGESPMFSIEGDFRILEHDTTEVNLVISPLQSIFRFRDSFRFTPEIEIREISIK